MPVLTQEHQYFESLNREASSTGNNCWNTWYQRRTQKEVMRLQKTDPLNGSAKNPRPAPACCGCAFSDMKEVFFIFFNF